MTGYSDGVFGWSCMNRAGVNVLRNYISYVNQLVPDQRCQCSTKAPRWRILSRVPVRGRSARIAGAVNVDFARIFKRNRGGWYVLCLNDVDVTCRNMESKYSSGHSTPNESQAVRASQKSSCLAVEKVTFEASWNDRREFQMWGCRSLASCKVRVVSAE
jgi:hypothetical protein